ncbi:MAG: hypothetical protein QM535_06970 [Limnohabitans sp.]|nr:hypothetical protein [Limnohabitans sp.]
MKKHLFILFFSFSIVLHSQETASIENTDSQTKTENKDCIEIEKTNSTTIQDSDFFDDVFIEILLALTYYSFVGDNEFEDHLNNKLTPYPYFDGICGNYSEDIVDEKIVRADIENNFLIGDSNSFGNHFKVKGRLKQYLYLQFDHHFIQQKELIQTSRIKNFQFNLGYDRLRFEKFNLGFLFGITNFDKKIDQTGFNLGLHSEAFIYKKFSLESNLMWSFADSFTSRNFDLKGKYHHKRYFASLGLENLKIDTTKYNFVSFGAGIYF